MSKTKPHHATKADIEQLTRAIDRIQDDSTRYLICMMVDLITQSIASQDKEEGESVTVEERAAAN